MKETCSRRGFTICLAGVEGRDVGSGIVDAVSDGEPLESTRGRFLVGVVYAGGIATETGSIVSGFAVAGIDAFLELETEKTTRLPKTLDSPVQKFQTWLIFGFWPSNPWMIR